MRKTKVAIMDGKRYHVVDDVKAMEKLADSPTINKFMHRFASNLKHTTSMIELHLQDGFVLWLDDGTISEYNLKFEVALSMFEWWLQNEARVQGTEFKNR